MDIDTTSTLAKIRYQFSVLKLGVNQLLLQLNPIQRFVVVAGIIMIIPGYWIMRWSSYGALNYHYNKSRLESRPSYTSTLPLRSSQPTLLKFEDGLYGALVNLTNPNQEISAYQANLHFLGYDKKGAAVYESKQDFYLLPGQKQSFSVPSFTSPVPIEKIETRVESIHWQKRFDVPTIEIEASNTPVEVGASGQEITFDGTIVNHSPFLLKETQVKYIVKDLNGQIIGIGSRIEKDVRTDERRTFPVKLKITTTQTEVQVETTAFSNPLEAENLKFK